MKPIDFDKCVNDYDEQLNSGLAISGENRDFYAKGRIELLAKCLKRFKFKPGIVLDYGCGTGCATPYFFKILDASATIGIDLSAESIAFAKRYYATSFPAEFKIIDHYKSEATVDLAFCNGVFHHIPPDERPQAVQYIAKCLRPGGVLALWENNPYNPGTRYIMSKVPFDKNAIMLKPREVKALVKLAGLSVLRIDYYFIFPHILKGFRFLEPYLTQFPLGGQYQVLSRKL